MKEKHIKSIGTIIPLGDGNTGKSVLIKQLTEQNKTAEKTIDIIQKAKKSLNIEIEYDTRTLYFVNKIVDTTLQYFAFPGQKQIISRETPTFDDIENVFEFLPSLNKVSVLLLVYDTSKIESLKSLEYWLKKAVEKNWLYANSKIILVSNKIDIQAPNLQYIDQIKDGILKEVLKNNLYFTKDQISSVNTSVISLDGIEELRNEIFDWVARHGIQLNVDL